MNRPTNIEEGVSEYLTLRELAHRFHCHPDTLRRHLIAGKLDGIEWVDFFKNGKLLATIKSVEAFESARREDTQRVYNQSIQNSRG